MGYNLTRFSVKRNQVQLDQLMEAEESVLFPHDHPRRLADKLREAVAAAYHFEEYQKYYNKIYHGFKFRIVPNGVLAEYTGDTTVGKKVESDSISSQETVSTSPEKVEKKATPTPPSKTIADVNDLVGVLSVLMKFPNDHEVSFPNAVLTQEEKENLFEWIEDKEWKLIDQGTNGVTVTKADVPEEVLWRG